MNKQFSCSEVCGKIYTYYSGLHRHVKMKHHGKW